MRSSSRAFFAVAAFTSLACASYACGTSGGGSSTVTPGGDGGNVDGGGEPDTSIVVDASPPDVIAPKAIAASRLGAGTDHACAARTDGTIACWGDNTSFKLGVEDAGAFSTTPVHATTLTGAVGVYGTKVTSCALTDLAELGCWGSNFGGLLGNLAAPSSSATPAKVGNLTDVVLVTTGKVHACLLRVGGKAFCWGNNDDEQLGSGVPGAGNSGAPARVEAPDKLKYLGSGPTSSHTCAIREDDQIICWGLNNKTGQLGAPTFDDIKSPTPLLVDNVTDAIRVATGKDHSCAIRKGGTLRCWGANDWGQLGFGMPSTGAKEKIAGDVPGITDATAVALGEQRTCIVRQNGKVLCWGLAALGGLGSSAADAGGYTMTPVEVDGISDAVDVTLGAGFGCALRQNGKISCWGVNDKGQLGNGAAADAGAFSTTPVEVVGF